MHNPSSTDEAYLTLSHTTFLTTHVPQHSRTTEASPRWAHHQMSEHVYFT